MSTSDLMLQIEKLRTELNSYAKLDISLTSPEVVKLSSRLDQLITRAQLLKKNEQRNSKKRRINRQLILRRYTIYSGRSSHAASKLV